MLMNENNYSRDKLKLGGKVLLCSETETLSLRVFFIFTWVNDGWLIIKSCYRTMLWSWLVKVKSFRSNIRCILAFISIPRGFEAYRQKYYISSGYFVSFMMALVKIIRGWKKNFAPGTELAEQLKLGLWIIN